MVLLLSLGQYVPIVTVWWSMKQLLKFHRLKKRKKEIRSITNHQPNPFITNKCIVGDYCGPVCCLFSIVQCNEYRVAPSLLLLPICFNMGPYYYLLYKKSGQ